MARTVYALLAGIDQYPAPIPQLHGCVNDINAIHQLLEQRIGGGDYQLDALVLTNDQATRQAVIDGFRNHLRKAGASDVALFYYSGHGSQEKAPAEFWFLEPDQLDETIVCYDSRMPNNYDLADKELAKLIEEIGANNPHTLIILDCCHSGSGTRAIDAPRVRRAPTDQRLRPVDTFIVSLDELKARPQTRGTSQTKMDWVTLPPGKHIAIAACRDDQEAKEYDGGGQQRGAFSYFLTDTLQHAGGSVTYRDLFNRTTASVLRNEVEQSPQIEASDTDDLEQPFLGGAVGAQTQYFTLSCNAADEWIIDGGAVHGIPPVSGDESTVLALFPFNASPDQLRDLGASIGTARVTAVRPNASTVEVSLRDKSAPDPQQTYKAVVTSLPMPALSVGFEGDADGLKPVRDALATAAPGGKPSLFVREGDSGGDQRQPALRLLAQNQVYRITRAGDDRALVADISGYSADNARVIVGRLEHIARWQTIAGLANPSSRLGPDAVHVDLYRVTGPPASSSPDSIPIEPIPSTSAIRIEYTQQNGTWTPPSFKVKLRNTSNERLYCALLDLTETFAVDPGMLPGGRIALDPGQEIWANGGHAITAVVPDQLWEQGITEFKDQLKLIASTADFDATLVKQPDLDMPLPARGVQRGLGPMSTLDRLMGRVQTRTFVTGAGNDTYADWIASEVSITTVRPLEGTPVPNTGTGATLGGAVTIEPHPQLQAQARLATAPQAGRDVGNLLLPAILRDNPLVSEPFQFTETRGTAPALRVLELSNIADPNVVTPDQPLVLHVDTPLAADEHVLPIGFDGEFFLPLGSGRYVDGRTEIRLERLPAAVGQGGTRDLGGSIRIMFQKIVGQRLGLQYPYPLLGANDLKDDGTVAFEPRPEVVSQRVSQAKRILLYIHGIIGDTRGMVASAGGLKLAAQLGGPAADGPSPLARQYDLLLTFDYENLNTPIEQIGRDLKQRLEAVGLGANHGKTLHIAAHSMGGLVARWFIEHEGGAQVAQHLVMLGTPNAGSPWPTVQALATTVLGIALNGLSIAAWPARILSGLMIAVEKVDVALDEMEPSSPLYPKLNTGDDPHVPYTILAGDTSIIPAVLQTQPNGQASRFAALLSRLTPGKLLDTAAALAFYGLPNDIAVSVESITHVPTNRTPQPEVHEVACDHLTYFSTAAGLAALAAALPEA